MPTSADTLLSSLSIPYEIRKAIILPFPNVRVRAFVADQSDCAVLFDEELKMLLLKHLKFTANGYKRLVHMAQKPVADLWSKFAYNHETLFGHYVGSREIKSKADITQLMITDSLK